MKIGNIDDAKLIYQHVVYVSSRPPAGWRKLGEGAYRISYLSPAGVVYKICHEGSKCNDFEFNNFRRLRQKRIRLPNGWRIAPVKRYSFVDGNDTVSVIAMKYIEGIHPIVPDHVSLDDTEEWLEQHFGAVKAFEKCNIWDMHEGNFLVSSSGKRYIIDLGE